MPEKGREEHEAYSLFSIGRACFHPHGFLGEADKNILQ
jgi:hypothetical protein